MLIQRMAENAFGGNVGGGRNPGDDAFNRFPGSTVQTLNMQGMQPDIVTLNREYRYRVKLYRGFQRRDKRLQDLRQVEVAAGRFRNFEYELRA